MNDKATVKLIFSALFAALTCVATMVIRIPAAPVGYIHAGDAVVLLAAFLIGGGWGALSAGIGSALADIVSGFVVYAPGTFIIKIITALIAGALLKRQFIKKPAARALFAGAVAETVMVALYFVYDAFVLGFGMAAIGSVPLNAVQAVCGTVAGAALFGALSKNEYFR